MRFAVMVALSGLITVTTIQAMAAVKRITAPTQRITWGDRAQVKTVQKTHIKQAKDTITVYRKQRNLLAKETVKELGRLNAELRAADRAADSAQKAQERNRNLATLKQRDEAIKTFLDVKKRVEKQSVALLKKQARFDNQLSRAKSRFQVLRAQNWRQFKTAQEVIRLRKVTANRRARDALIARRQAQGAMVTIPPPPNTPPPPLPPANATLAVPSSSGVGNSTQGYKARRPRSGAHGGHR